MAAAFASQGCPILNPKHTINQATILKVCQRPLNAGREVKTTVKYRYIGANTAQYIQSRNQTINIET